MKNFKAIAAFVLMASTFWACDQVVDITAPTMVAEVAADADSATITFAVSTPAGYASATVTASEGTASITSEPDAGAESGDVVVSFGRGDAEGSVIVTLTVTDDAGATETATATVDVEEPIDLSTTFEEVAFEDEDGLFLYNIVTITDKGEGIGNYTMDAGNVYVLNGFVFVNSGQTLTIPAGTVIKGKSGQGENASALIVARGGSINATGTSAAPIIFTAEADGIAPGEVVGTLPSNARGLWGGVIVLGAATNNNTTTDKFIEGLPATDTRSQYGGTDDADNSGTIKYVSIRHGGTDIGNGNEINGLTLGSVGNGTTIEHIEVIANKDDGVEWFGGSANVKWVLVANCGDDSFDYDEGWHGNVQYAATFHAGTGDRAGEHDGGPSDNETGMPYAIPTFANMTYIGQGVAAGENVIELRDNAGGFFYNAIFYGWGGGVDIEVLGTAENDGSDSYAQWAAGNLNFQGVQYFEVDDNIFEGDAETDFDMTAEFTSAVTEQDPAFDATNVATNRAAGVDLSGMGLPAFFDATTEPGAFVGGAWHAGWTLWANSL